MALKTAGALERSEWETNIPEWVFKKLWFKVGTRIIEKVRYNIPYGNRVIEVNVYTGRLHGLVMAEVEFDDLDSARAFIMPLPAAVDVTDNEAYQNFNLAIYDLPFKDEKLSKRA